MDEINLGDVAVTSLLTVYCHAIETQSKDPILNDPKSVEMMNALDGLLSKSENKLHKELVGRKLKKSLVTHIAVRAKKYDGYARDFLKNHPDGVVVNIGCGLDYRYSRVDNGSVFFYDLDLPEVINIKKHFVEESDRYHMIASSVFNYDWFTQVSGHKGPFLFMAEGVFMYLPPDNVKTLILQLQKAFPGSELVCEIFNSFWLKKPWKNMIELKLQKEMHMGKNAIYQFGVKDANEIEKWSKGIRLLDEWSYFDSDEKKLGLMKYLGKIQLIRKTQWTAHYKLDKK